MVTIFVISRSDFIVISFLYGHCTVTWALSIAAAKKKERRTQECPVGQRTHKLKTLEFDSLFIRNTVFNVLYRLCNKGNVGSGSLCVLSGHPSPLLQCYCFPADNPAHAKRTEAFQQIRHRERGSCFRGLQVAKRGRGLEVTGTETEQLSRQRCRNNAKKNCTDGKLYVGRR
jgi:hypothetical protein